MVCAWWEKLPADLERVEIDLTWSAPVEAKHRRQSSTADEHLDAAMDSKSAVVSRPCRKSKCQWPAADGGAVRIKKIEGESSFCDGQIPNSGHFLGFGPF